MHLNIGQKRSEPGDIVDALLECHQRIRYFVGLAVAVGEGGDLPAAEVAEAGAGVERYFTQALPLHVRDEEESLAPRLTGLTPELDRALGEMAAEHEAHGPALAELLGAVKALRERPLDRGLRLRLATAAATLREAFEAHLRLEEAQIFPALRGLLPEATRVTLLAELRARRQSG